MKKNYTNTDTVGFRLTDTVGLSRKEILAEVKKANAVKK
jgi:hypothetical protein